MRNVDSSLRDDRARLTLAATLGIGLGGTGSEVVRYLKQRVRTSIVPRPKIIDFLVVDTVPRQNPVGKERLDWQEYAYIGDYVASVVLENLDQYPEIEEWWPFQGDSGSIGRFDRKLGAIHAGARQRRPIGRLSLFRKYYEFSSRLDPKLRNINAIVAKEELQREGHSVVRNKLVRVYIICSLCGGTGAGIFLDVAFKLRKELRDQAYITGVFVLPSVFVPLLRSRIQQRRVQANTCASLLELNHYMNTGRALNVKFPGEPAQDLDRPFDRVFLIENVNLRGEYLDHIDDVHRMIAQEIFLESASPIGAEHWNRDVNLTEEFVKDSHIGSAVMAYSSFATASLVLPTSKIRARAVARLADEMLLKGIVGGHLMSQDQGIVLKDAVTRRVERMQQSLESTLAFAPGAQETAPSAIQDEWETAVEATWDQREMEDVARQELDRVLDELLQETLKVCIQHGFAPALDFVEKLGNWVRGKIRSIEQGIQDLTDEIQRREQDAEDLREETATEARRQINIRDIVGELLGRGRNEIQVGVGDAITLWEEQIDRHREDQWFLKLRNEAWGCVLDNLDFLSAEVRFITQSLKEIGEDLKEESLRGLTTGTAVGQVFDLVSEIDDPEYVAQRAAQVFTDIRLRANTLIRYIEDYVARYCAFELLPQERRRSTRFTTMVGYAGKKERSHRSEIATFTRKVIDDLLEKRLRGERIIDYLRKRYRDDPRLEGAPEDPLRLLFERCDPFWKTNPDLGFSEGDMEMVALVGVDIADEASWQLFEDFRFDLISTGNSERIDLSHSHHGLPLRYLGSIDEYKYCYDELRRLGEVLHVHRDWERNGLDSEM